jgi:hypothetical protein
MELDDAVLAHAYGEVGDSAACALWEGFLRCVRVLSCEPRARVVVQTCAVTCHRPSTTQPSPQPTLEERRGRMLVTADQGHSYFTKDSSYRSLAMGGKANAALSLATRRAQQA